MAETPRPIGPETSQSSFQERLEVTPPDQLAYISLKRRQRLAASETSAQERIRLEQEIEAISRRAALLREDKEAPDFETVRTRQVAIGQEFARLDQGGEFWSAREGLNLRLRLLNERAETLRRQGTVIRAWQRGQWKAREEYSGQALAPQQWEQLSPRLVQNPNANVDEQQEYQWYLSTLSPDKRREVKALSIQMKPIDDQVRAVVCMPAYKEGGNIYRTIANYAGQTEHRKSGEKTPNAFDYRKLRIVVFDNRPVNTPSDNTEAEVLRFKKDHPEVQIDFIKAQIDPKVAMIGHIRNMLTAAVIENAAANRTKTTRDLICVSNDADMPESAIRKTYVADIINEFDAHPNMDAMAGKIDFPEYLMAQVPVQLATRRLWQYMDTLINHKLAREPFLVGRNSALRLKIMAAVGNYDPIDRAGEDVEIGNKIKWIRSWDVATGAFDKNRIKGGKHQEDNRIRYVHGISLDSDPRRDVARILGNERIRNQYSYFERQQGVRGKSGAQLTEQAVTAGFGVFNRNLFQLEAVEFYYDSQRWSGGPEIFARAMSILGAKWAVKNGEFRLTDTSVLEAGIKELRFREFQQERIENWLGVKVRYVSNVSQGENNQVFTMTTADRRELVVRISAQQDRNKFASEKIVVDLLQRLGLAVPRIMAIDVSRNVIPGRVISVSERLPGQSFSRSYEAGEVNDQFLRQAGEVLRRIHEVPINKGYWFVGESGEGTQPSWEQSVLEAFKQPKYAGLASKNLVDMSDINAAVTWASSRRGLLKNAPKQLLHGDFTLGNILQKDGQLTGILDFENAKSGDPLWDIAHFMVYEGRRIGPNGLDDLLAGYGNSNLLSTPEAKDKFNLYKLANILYGLEWYSYQPQKTADITWLNTQLKETLAAVGKSPEAELAALRPTTRTEINGLLKGRFDRAVEWFRNFYRKGVPNDQEFAIGEHRYQELSGVIGVTLQRGDTTSKEQLFQALKADSQIATSGFSDTEIKRQVDRLVETYRRDPLQFAKINTSNPAFRTIVFLRNRGKLARYEGEYKNLTPDIDFRKIVIDLARAKTARGERISILDEGGTFDVALQQLAGVIKYFVPNADLELASIAADDMAKQFADCHKYPVDHRMADVHRLNEVFGGKKRSLIISQAAYKFFWDPVGAIVESANALEKDGWAFLGDIRDRTSYKIFEMFRDENGRPMEPQAVFAYLNTLNLGYKFQTGMHTSMRDGEPRQVMTLAIHKETDQNINLPIFYGLRNRDKNESDWLSPLVYLIARNSPDKFASFTRVAGQGEIPVPLVLSEPDSQRIWGESGSNPEEFLRRVSVLPGVSALQARREVVEAVIRDMLARGTAANRGEAMRKLAQNGRS